MNEPLDCKTVLYQLIASLTLADHMVDVSAYIGYALKKLGDPLADIAFDELGDLGIALAERGITTLHGTSLSGF